MLKALGGLAESMSRWGIEMRQEGKSGFSASQPPNRRGTRKGTLSRGRGEVWTPSSWGQPAWDPPWRGEHSLPEWKGIAGARGERSKPGQLPLQGVALLSPCELHSNVSLEGIPFYQAIQMHCPYRLTRQFNSEKIWCSLTSWAWMGTPRISREQCVLWPECDGDTAPRTESRKLPLMGIPVQPILKSVLVF